MGRILLVCRLAGRDLRRRPVEAALVLLAIMAGTTTLTLWLVLHDVVSDPYRNTRQATAGPDVVAMAYPGSRAADAAGLEELDQPSLTHGGWVAAGSAVVEAAFADALGVGVGDRITLNGRSWRVGGMAVSAAMPPYLMMSPPGTAENPLQYCPLPAPSPCDQLADGGDWTPELDVALRRVDFEHPGLVWLTETDVRSLAPRPESLNYVMNLKLRDPAAAPAFATAHRTPLAADPDQPGRAVLSWQQIRAQIEANLARTERRTLLIGSQLLGLLAVASVAVLVGARMAGQTRRVGLLKAVGGTPGLVAAVLLAEYLVVALLAAAAGLAAGWLTAPLLTDPGAGLLGSAGAPSMTLSTVVLVTVVALGVAAVPTLVPAIRAARTSTVRALADSARIPRRSPWLIAFSARLPVPLLLGLRVAARRPRRAVLGVVSIAITVSGMVAALSADAQQGEDRGSTIINERVDQVLLVITITLAVLAAINAIFITGANALDAKHSSALARALGATPTRSARDSPQHTYYQHSPAPSWASPQASHSSPPSAATTP